MQAKEASGPGACWPCGRRVRESWEDPAVRFLLCFVLGIKPRALYILDTNQAFNHWATSPALGMILKVSGQNWSELLPREFRKTMKIRECGRGKEFVLWSITEVFLLTKSQ